MEQYGEVQIPVMEEKPHKDKKWKLVVGIAAACLIVIAAVVVFAFKVLHMDSALVKGVRNLTQEMNERRKLWEEATGNSLMNELNKVKTTMVLNLSGEELPFTIGIDTSVVRDGDARKTRAQMELSIMNNRLLGAELYGEDDEIMVSLPDFLEENLVFDAKGIDKQYNQSVFAEEFGEIEEQDFYLDLFPEESHFMWTELFLDMQEAADSKEETEGLPEIAIEELEEKAQITIPERENKQYQCSQYRIVIPEERVRMALGESEDDSVSASADVQQDISVMVSIDENDRIVQISFDEPLTVNIKSEEYEMPVLYEGDISFVGEDRAVDDILVNMRAEVSFADIKYAENPMPSLIRRIHMEDDKLEVQFGMEIVYNETDASVTTEIDELTISVGDLGTYKITGSMTTEPLREEIEPMEGERIRIFEITQDQYDELEGELQQKMLRWLMALSMLEEW